MEAVSPHEDRLRALLDAGVAITSELSLDALLQRLSDKAVELTGARYGALGVIDRDGSGLERFITTGLDARAQSAIGEPPHGRGILGALIREAKPLTTTASRSNKTIEMVSKVLLSPNLCRRTLLATDHVHAPRLSDAGGPTDGSVPLVAVAARTVRAGAGARRRHHDPAPHQRLPEAHGRGRLARAAQRHPRRGVAFALSTNRFGGSRPMTTRLCARGLP